MNYQQEVRVFISPYIAPQEHIVGFALRKSFFETRSFEQAEAINPLITTKGWLLPSNLAAFARICAQTMGNMTMETWLNDHTLLPLLTSFLNDERKQRLTEHHSGPAQTGAWALAGLHGSTRGRMGICTDCLKENYETLGFGIWTRLFLMASIFACPIHERPLFTFCRACDVLSSRQQNWRPSIRCACGRSLITIANLNDKMHEVAVKNAAALNNVLNNGLPAGINALVLRTALSEKLQLHSKEQIQEALTDSIGRENLDLYGFTSGTYGRLSNLRQARPTLLNPVQSLLIIQSLFGGLEKLVALLQTPSMNDSKTPFRRTGTQVVDEYQQKIETLPLGKLEARTEKYRNKVLSKIPSLSNRTLQALHRAGLRREIIHLKATDLEWLEKHTLCTRGPHKPCPDSPGIDLEDADSKKQYFRTEKIRSIVLDIYKMYLHLVSTQPLKRISQRALLSATPFRWYRRYLNEVPEISFILNACVDDEMRLSNRRAAVYSDLIKNRHPHPSYSDPHWYMPASSQTRYKRFKRAEKWLDNEE